MSACAPKTAESGNHAPNSSPASSTTPSSVAPAALPNSVDLEMLTSAPMKGSEAGNDWYEFNIAFAKGFSSAGAENSAALLASLNKAIAKDYFAAEVQPDAKSFQNALAAKVKEIESSNGSGEPPLAEQTVLFNDKGFLSLELRRLADMDTREYYTYDLHTGAAIEVEKAISKEAVAKHIEAKNKFYTENAAYWKRKNEVSIHIKRLWLTQKGLAIEFLVELSPDAEEFCGGDECWNGHTIPFSELAGIVQENSPLARLTK